MNLESGGLWFSCKGHAATCGTGPKVHDVGRHVLKKVRSSVRLSSLQATAPVQKVEPRGVCFTLHMLHSAYSGLQLRAPAKPTFKAPKSPSDAPAAVSGHVKFDDPTRRAEVDSELRGKERFGLSARPPPHAPPSRWGPQPFVRPVRCAMLPESSSSGLCPPVVLHRCPAGQHRPRHPGSKPRRGAVNLYAACHLESHARRSSVHGLR